MCQSLFAATLGDLGEIFPGFLISNSAIGPTAYEGEVRDFIDFGFFVSEAVMHPDTKIAMGIHVATLPTSCRNAVVLRDAADGIVTTSCNRQ